jgi:2-octaprenyl-6-methoxyphenol hydroxylase
VAFGQAGFSVICADPPRRSPSGDAEGRRSAHHGLPATLAHFLDRIGLWERLAPHAMPLQVMRIVDAGGAVAEPRVAHDFDAATSRTCPLAGTCRTGSCGAKWSRISRPCRMSISAPAPAPAMVLTREAEARVTLSDGSRVRCEAGDRRRRAQFSPVREATGIGVRTTRYGQKALAFAVTHPIPHDNVSTEIHRSGGPFTLVPLPDHDGRPVLGRGLDGTRAGGKAPCRLGRGRVQRGNVGALGHLFGPLTLVSRRTVWPIISQSPTGCRPNAWRWWPRPRM